MKTLCKRMIISPLKDIKFFHLPILCKKSSSKTNKISLLLLKSHNSTIVVIPWFHNDMTYLQFIMMKTWVFCLLLVINRLEYITQVICCMLYFLVIYIFWFKVVRLKGLASIFIYLVCNSCNIIICLSIVQSTLHV